MEWNRIYNENESMSRSLCTVRDIGVVGGRFALGTSGRTLDAPIDGGVLGTASLVDLLSLLAGDVNEIDTWIGVQLGLVGDALKEREVVEIGLHPVSQILDISDAVEDATNTQEVRVDGEQRTRDNAPTKVLSLEMRIRKENKNATERGRREKVRQKLHAIARHHGGVGERQCQKTLVHVLHDFATNFNANCDFVWKETRQGDSHAAKATAKVEVRHRAGPRRVGWCAWMRPVLVCERIHVCFDSINPTSSWNNTCRRTCCCC